VRRLGEQLKGGQPEDLLLYSADSKIISTSNAL
jgi:hypothetical protein